MPRRSRRDAPRRRARGQRGEGGLLEGRFARRDCVVREGEAAATAREIRLRSSWHEPLLPTACVSFPSLSSSISLSPPTSVFHPSSFLPSFFLSSFFFLFFSRTSSTHPLSLFPSDAIVVTSSLERRVILEWMKESEITHLLLKVLDRKVRALYGNS